LCIKFERDKKCKNWLECLKLVALIRQTTIAVNLSKKAGFVEAKVLVDKEVDAVLFSLAIEQSERSRTHSFGLFTA
jgi:uncharacterized protein (DUF885 family)